MIYLELFLSFLQIGLFSFGGGYAALALIQDQVVSNHGWLSISEFSNLITISEMTPGPIAINAATFVGMKIAGVGGATVATLGCILPSCLIVSILTYLYNKYKNLSTFKEVLGMLRPAVVAMIASSGLTIIINSFLGAESSLGLNNVKIDQIILFLGAFMLIKFKKCNPILVMLLCGGAKLLFGL